MPSIPLYIAFNITTMHKQKMQPPPVGSIAFYWSSILRILPPCHSPAPFSITQHITINIRASKFIGHSHHPVIVFFGEATIYNRPNLPLNLTMIAQNRRNISFTLGKITYTWCKTTHLWARLWSILRKPRCGAMHAHVLVYFLGKLSCADNQ